MPNLILISVKNDYFVEKNLNLLNHRFSSVFWYAKNPLDALKIRMSAALLLVIPLKFSRLILRREQKLILAFLFDNHNLLNCEFRLLRGYQKILRFRTKK